MYVEASYKIRTKIAHVTHFANLAQLIWRMQSTRLVTSTTLNHNLGRQQILREGIFCKLSNTFEHEVRPIATNQPCPASVLYRYTYDVPVQYIRVLRVRTGTVR